MEFLLDGQIVLHWPNRAVPSIPAILVALDGSLLVLVRCSAAALQRSTLCSNVARTCGAVIDLFGVHVVDVVGVVGIH